MRRFLLQAAAWALATGGAVALSWFGVSGALSDGAESADVPRAFTVPDAGRATARAPLPSADPPSSPAPSPSSGTLRPARPAPPSAVPSRARHRQHHPRPSPSLSDGTPRAVSSDGGRVALMLHAHSAELISATPRAGWAVQVWRDPEWIRVEFSSGARTSTVFCTWNGHPPMVEVAEERG